MKKKTKKIIIGVAIGIVAFMALSTLITPHIFTMLQHQKVINHPGNQVEYRHVADPKTDSPLKGKRIVFLGSSVTKGEGADGRSFVEYLAEDTGLIPIKNAISGTTLVDELSPSILAYGNGSSYVKRLKEINLPQKPDAVVVQLSTNDASMKKKLGTISNSRNMDDMDAHTITGAIETILAYVKDKWGCPVIFYTNPHFESARYKQMVDRLHELQDKWGFKTIDLYSNTAFNKLSAKQRELYQFDDVHPTQAGYRDWWLPEFEKELDTYLAK